MIRDGYGNELKPGDTVHVQCGPTWIKGVIEELKPGGTIIQHDRKSGTAVMSGDGLVIRCIFNLDQPPGQRQTSVLRLVDPEKDVLTTKGN